MLITSTERVRIDTEDDKFMPAKAIRIEELGKLDCARLFMKQARGHLTSSQFRQCTSKDVKLLPIACTDFIVG